MKPKKRKKRSVQDLIGIRSFTRYGIETDKGELVFFLVSPTNISVLSLANIENKIRHLMMVLSAVPDIEIVCTDSSECFDSNKAYLHTRLDDETNPNVRRLIERDIESLDSMGTEMAAARQFMFVIRERNQNEKQMFDITNSVTKAISDQGFEVTRMMRKDIKRILAIYFEATVFGEHMPDVDGEQYIDRSTEEE